jgi:hypothetical protein
VRDLPASVPGWVLEAFREQEARHVSAEQGSDHCSASEPLSPDLSTTADDECFRTGSVRPRLAPERPGEVVEMDDLFSTTDALAKKSSFT